MVLAELGGGDGASHSRCDQMLLEEELDLKADATLGGLDVWV